MTAIQKKLTTKILSTIEKGGLLMQSDSQHPSIVSIVTGDLIKGSWWGHPMGNLIFNICCDLDDDGDLASIKLINGKVTYVHRKLWPSVFLIGSAKEKWQVAKLTKNCSNILRKVEMLGLADADDFATIGSKEFAKAVNQLEKNLLLATQQIHTESGHHAHKLITWEKWREEHPFKLQKMTVIEARAILEGASPARTLPWQIKS